MADALNQQSTEGFDFEKSNLDLAIKSMLRSLFKFIATCTKDTDGKKTLAELAGFVRVTYQFWNLDNAKEKYHQDLEKAETQEEKDKAMAKYEQRIAEAKSRKTHDEAFDEEVVSATKE